MGYDLHITRRDDWTTPTPNDITYEEWKRLADADPDFQVCGESRWVVNAVLSEDESRPENPPADEVIETYNCYGLLTSEYYPSFDYRNGRVVTSVPYDDATARKLFEVAAKLGAVVQGDEGEYYRRTDDGYETSLVGDFNVILHRGRFSS